MPTIVHEFDWPDRIVVGTVGQPGARTFYLQVRGGRRVVSAALEKEQSAILAAKIDEILDELMAGEGNPFSIQATTPVELVDNEPLETPVDEQFRTGAIGLGWDPATAQVVIEAYPLVVVDEDDIELTEDGDGVEAIVVEPEEMLLVRMPVGTARAFAKRTREIVGAGRPLCPRCGDPMDPEGHDCVFPEG
ncbi:DUF3090 domain-containing protein [Herbiconiux sp. YIM B11900]|uniref:DUF3090 domain-containing protein n=1 Tax=Herbiconiux sp. YIM B11900 TaxID=3404131 RepID=UPI003F82A7CD